MKVAQFLLALAILVAVTRSSWGAQPQGEVTLLPFVDNIRVDIIRLSPDDRTVLTGGADYRIWDLRTGRLIDIAPRDKKSEMDVVLGPDRRIAVARQQDGAIQLYEPLTDRIRWRIPRPSTCENPWADGRFSGDGSTLLVIRSCQPATVFSTATGSLIETFQRKDLSIARAASADRFIAYHAEEDKKIKVWDRQAKGVKWSQPYPWKSGSVMASSTDGHIVVVYENGKAEIVSSSGILSLFGPGSNVCNVFAFVPSSHLAAFAIDDGAVHLWDLDSKRHLRAFAGTIRVDTLTFSHDGAYLLGGGRYGVDVWERATGKLLLTIGGRFNDSAAAAISPDGRKLAGTRGRKFWVAELSSHPRLRSFDIGNDDPGELAFTPDGNALAIMGLKGASLYSTELGTNLVQYRIHTAVTNGITVSADGSTVALSTNQGPYVLERTSGIILAHLPTGSGSSHRPAISASGEYVAWYDGKDHVFLWNRASGGSTSSIWPFHPSRSAFCPDNKCLFFCERDRVVVLELATNKTADITSLDSSACSFAFSHRTSRVYLGTDNGSIWTVDRQSLSQRGTLIGRTASRSRLVALALSRGGNYLMSLDAEGSLVLWELGENRVLLTLITFSDNEWLAYTPDGRYAASPNGARGLMFAIGGGYFGHEEFAPFFEKRDILEMFERFFSDK